MERCSERKAEGESVTERNGVIGVTGHGGGTSGFELSAGPSEQYGCRCLAICRDSRVLDKDITAVYVHT